MEGLQTVTVDHEGIALTGGIASPGKPGPHPAVLVFPSAFGLGGHIPAIARRLAAEGYVALAVDMYGGGLYTEDQDAIAAVIGPLWGTDLQRSRATAWLDFLTARQDVRADRIAAIGYCFGGQCVLELARGGADIKAVVSYHGILTTSQPARMGGVRAEVVVYTGGNDPHAPREHVDALRDEMVAAGATWQITEFGSAYHAFTDPEAATPGTGRAYDAMADRISWSGTLALLNAVLRDSIA